MKVIVNSYHQRVARFRSIRRWGGAWGAQAALLGMMSSAVAYGQNAASPATPSPGSASPTTQSTPEEPTPQIDDDGREQFVKAAAAVEANRMAEARHLLLGLWHKKKTFDVAALLAQVERLVGRTEEAANHAQFALAHYPPSESKAAWARIHGFLAEVRPQLLSIRLRGLPPNGELRMDKTELDLAPLPEVLFASPGKHILTVRSEGREAPVEVVGKAGETVEANFQWDARGRAVVQAPAEDFEVNPRTHHHKAAVGVPVLIGAAGLVVLGTAVGVAFDVSANNKEQTRDTLFSRLGSHSACRINPALGDCAELRSVNSSIRSNRTWETAGWITTAIGGVGLLGATGYLLFWPEKKHPPAKRDRAMVVLPYAQPSGGGLTVSGAF